MEKTINMKWIIITNEVYTEIMPRLILRVREVASEVEVINHEKTIRFRSPRPLPLGVLEMLHDILRTEIAACQAAMRARERAAREAAREKERATRVIVRDKELRDAIETATKSIKALGTLLVDGNVLDIADEVYPDRLVRQLLRARVLQHLNGPHAGYYLPWRWEPRPGGRKPGLSHYKAHRITILREMTSYWVKNDFFGSLTPLIKGNVANKIRQLYKYNDSILVADKYFKDVEVSGSRWRKYRLDLSDSTAADQSALRVQGESDIILEVTTDVAVSIYARLRITRRLRRSRVFLNAVERWRHDLWRPHGPMPLRHFAACDLD